MDVQAVLQKLKDRDQETEASVKRYRELLDESEDEDSEVLEDFIKSLKQRPVYGTYASDEPDAGNEKNGSTDDRRTKDSISTKFRKRVRIHLHR